MQGYIYLFIREDLSIPQQIIQTAHAVDELNKNITPNEEIDNMVLFAVKGERSLENISKQLVKENISYSMFYEPDIDQYTSIATEPIYGEQREFFKQFKLKRS
jgi:hypothetical protein